MIDIDNYMVKDIEWYNEAHEDDRIDFSEFVEYAFNKSDISAGVQGIISDFEDTYNGCLSLEENYVVFIEWLGELDY